MLEFGFSAILAITLVSLALIDARTYRLPDLLTLPLILIGLVASYVLDRSLINHTLGAVLGYGGLVTIELAYLRLRGRPGLGRGDAKLLAAGGAWCGALALPFILLVASMSALSFVLVLKLVFKRELDGQSLIAFGPFLSFAIGLVYLMQIYGLSV